MSMRGASRASWAALADRLAAEDIPSAAVATRLGNELFSVVGLLDSEHGLRRALGDPGKPAAEKGAIAGALLHGKVTQRTEGLVAAAVESHWARLGDMVDAIEELAVSALVLAADTDNILDDLEDELFRFNRVVSAQPDLRAALADPGLPEDRKHDLIGALLGGKVSARPGQSGDRAPARPLAERGAGHVRRYRGAPQGAADRRGAVRDRAVRGPARAARGGAIGVLRAQNSPQYRA
jgi:F-type H+-transporting ATPase subunit delta